jgi:hypothetical protein
MANSGWQTGFILERVSCEKSFGDKKISRGENCYFGSNSACRFD